MGGNGHGNAQIVAKAYEAFGRGDIPTVLGLLSDDVTWTAPATIPQGGSFSGRDGVMTFFVGLGAAWSELKLDVEAIGAVGDSIVVGIVRGDGALVSGAKSGYGAVHVFGIREGRISSFREYTDLDAPVA